MTASRCLLRGERSRTPQENRNSQSRANASATGSAASVKPLATTVTTPAVTIGSANAPVQFVNHINRRGRTRHDQLTRPNLQRAYHRYSLTVPNVTHPPIFINSYLQLSSKKR
jgi:hypothetical protein